MKNGLLNLNAAVFATASVVGKKESEGPLGDRFDWLDDTDRFGVQTWEEAESEMQRIALNVALSKAGMKDTALGAVFAGDLLNQCVGSAYGLLTFRAPYFGLYGACSTCAEGLLLAAAMVSADYFACCGTVTSSHYCSAERQFRTPLEYGAQRAPTAQWTVTGAGAFLLERERECAMKGNEGRAVICRGMPGIAQDKGMKDAANMGAAMAPAAADTLLRYFDATQSSPQEYDCIATGDLGYEGGDILCDLMRAEGAPLSSEYTDCGRLIYHRQTQDVHSGGSGCGCSAVVLSAHLLPKIRSGEWKKLLFLSTGALMSPDSIKQGKSIPSIAHLLEFQHKEG